MQAAHKNQDEILSKLKIERLNPMQEAAAEAILNHKDTVLISPTGTGKTLAFLLPILQQLDPLSQEVQVIVLVPSRELAIQIEQVIREMGTGFKANAVYGGKSASKDRLELKHRPAILVGTPGRLADHLRRGTFSTATIKTLVLDEFDKSLEIGFELEMLEIVGALQHVEQKILTSATYQAEVPNFVQLKRPQLLDFSDSGESKLQLQVVLSPERDKLGTLVETLNRLGNQPGIVFCNFKDSIDRISEYLFEHGIHHGVFYGGMEQVDRERALIQFRNGTYSLLLATDLAARGIDIPELKFIMHYHLPNSGAEFTHRNGRTARMNSDGMAYILKWEKEDLPDFIADLNPMTGRIRDIVESTAVSAPQMKTLFISGGRKDKISKGDIAGLFFKQGELGKDQLGLIEIKNDCAFVAVSASQANHLIKRLNNTKLKNKKVRISAL